MEMPTRNWTLVVAISQNGVIGRGNALPWRLKRDLQRFKQFTMGHCLLMGRKTWDSIGRPLPGRQTIVLSRQADLSLPEGVTRAGDLVHVEELVEPGREVMVVGGAELYRLALPHCNRMLWTQVLAEVDGDTWFPKIDWSQWRKESSEPFPADAENQWPCEYQLWKRQSEGAS
jgi:dihydrofolate reductase